MIEIKQLSKNINNQQILQDINLTVPKGSIYGIIGPNGAGKTTLIRHMIGAYIPDNGEVTYEGQMVFENNDIKQKVVYIPDEFPTTFGSNIQEIAKLYANIYPTWSQARYEKLVSLFNQNTFKKFNYFSKGMKKQVLFVLALSIMPEYLIMDEPFDGIDVIMRKEIWKILTDDVLERNMTIFISSHHLKELDATCDTVALINEGKVVLEYNLDDLKQKIHKVQVAFHSMETYTKVRERIHVLHEDTIGKINTWIVEGDIDRIIDQIELYDPLIIESLTLSLEEIFLFALGGEENEIRTLFD